jgi:hypothetical protein
VFRRQEALKTLVHELLHAFGVAQWANDDAEAVSNTAEWYRGVARVASWPRPLPAECIVDALATLITVALWGASDPPGAAADWDACVAFAETRAARLSAHFAGLPWRTTTAALEYYVVKPALMRNIDALMAAHRQGLARPDKAACRRLLRYPAQPAAAAAAAASRARQPRRALRSRCMRMTPATLAPLARMSSS